MKLISWLIKNNITQKEFALLINVKPPTVSEYCNGKKIPRKEIMQRIYLVTKGQVAPNDFYDLGKCKINSVQMILI